LKTNIITQKVFADAKNRYNLHGYFVAFKSNQNELKIGYSFCRKGDKFNKKEGLHRAMQRACTHYSTMQVPTFMDLDEFEAFIYRAESHFPHAQTDVAVLDCVQ